MSLCPTPEQLRQLLAEQLTDAEREPLEAHIEGCALCQQLLVELTRDPDSEKGWTGSDAQRCSQYESAGTLLHRLKQRPAKSAADLGRASAGETQPFPGQDPKAAGENWPRLPSYEVLGVLGRGGMGIVYRARHLALNRPVALKMIQTGYRGQDAMLARFRTEAEAIARLQHPHVVQIYEVGEHDGLPYLSLEIVEGGSLSQRLDGTPLPAQQAAQLVETLARAVHSAHRRGLIHRDLKPANVLLTIEGTPKVSDFGLAKLMDSGSGQTATGEVLGTPSYMSPEQAESERLDVGPATDVYALGAILYELLTGRPPFRAVTALETLMQVVHQEPVPPRQLQSSTPCDLETICLKCLQKDPRKRYASAEALAEDLDRFLQNRPIRARPVSPWERSWKWTKRQPASAMLIAVSTLAALTLVLGGLWYGARLQAAMEESKQNAQTAEERRREALANYVKARDAVDHMLTEVAEKDLVHIPQAEPARLALLNKALEFYQNLAKEAEADWDIRFEKARALHRVGDICRYLERFPDAEKAYRQTIETFLELTGERPDDVDALHYLAAAYNSLGILSRTMRQLKQAEEFYRKALNIRLQLHHDHPDETRFQSALAQSYNNLGNLHRSTNRLDTAEVYYRDSLENYEKLEQADPESADRQYDVASAYCNLSLLYEASKRFDDGERILQKTEKKMAVLLDKYPSVAKYRDRLSFCQLALGNIYMDRGWFERAQTCYRKAMEYEEPLARDHSFNPDYQTRWGMACYNLGYLYRSKGRHKEAEPLYEKVLESSQALARRYPKNLNRQKSVGVCYSNLGNCVKDNGRPQEALPLYAEAIRRLEEVFAKERTNAEFRKVLRDALAGEAEALTALSRHEEALRRWDRAFELADARSRDNLCLARAGTLARRGDHREAVAAARTVTEKKPTFDVLYGKACVYSLAASAARQDTKLGSDERERLADQYASQAVAVLAEADKAGFLKSKDRRQQAQSDKNLVPIRDREDFKRLLDEVETKAKQPAPP